MPCTCPSTRTTSWSASTYTTAQARARASTAPTMMIRGSSTLRYTSSRMSSTVTRATASSSPSMPEKASDRSAWVAAGPASHTVVPGTADAARSISPSVGASSSPRSGRSCTTPRSAAPSSEGSAGDGVPTTPGRPASEASARVAADRVSGPSGAPPGEVQTTSAGSVSSWRKARWASITRVDSALRGRNAAWSLVATSPSFPAYGPSPPPTASQRTSRTRGSRRADHRAGRDMRTPGQGSLGTEKVPQGERISMIERD